MSGERADRVRLVVLAWGNESRGDDGLGPAFLEAARTTPEPEGVATTYVEDFQLQPEHCLDLAGQDLVLFVDAARDARHALQLDEARPRAAAFTTHGVAPAAVLDAYRLTFGRAPPPAFELGIRATRFALGTSLSARARHDLAAALALFARLRARPDVAAWRALASCAKEEPCASQPP
jgi:hydrogenase maturation protease